MTSIEDTIRESNELIDNGELRQAAELIENALPQYPEEQQSLFYCLLCIASMARDKSGVLALFQRSREAGVWWAPELIQRDEDFHWLLEDADFQQEMKRLKTTTEQHQTTSQAISLDKVHGEQQRWIVNLHKRNNSNQRMLRYFEDSNARLGRRTRYVQSSQVSSSNGYSWNGVEAALSSLRDLTRDLADSGPIFCGTSQGGNIAFLYALTNGTDYLGVMPAIRDESLAKLGSAPSGKTVMLVGDNDPVRGNVLRARDQILALGGNVEVISMGPVGHWLPDDFADYYERALKRLS